MDEPFLRDRIREAMRAGELPTRLPDQVLGGAASGGCCVFCGESTLGGVEIELVFADEGPDGERTYYAHPRCFSIFQREIDGLVRRPASFRDHAAAD